MHTYVYPLYRGVYKNEDGSLGIKFVCRQGYLQVKTLNDIILVYFSSYSEVDKRKARSVYMLDGEYLQHKSNASSVHRKSVSSAEAYRNLKHTLREKQ